jgi:hypothetical protein
MAVTERLFQPHTLSPNKSVSEKGRDAKDLSRKQFMTETFCHRTNLSLRKSVAQNMDQTDNLSLTKPQSHKATKPQSLECTVVRSITLKVADVNRLEQENLIRRCDAMRCDAMRGDAR